MTDQKSLLPSELVPAVPPAPIKSPLADMRAGAMSVDVATMVAALSEYTDRRKAFRDWLLSKLVEGIHFGYPPGCEPKLDADGNIMQWQRGKDGDKGKYVTIPKKQWQAKPSFYKAGADFVCDLLGVRDEYDADMQGWEQLGKPTGTFVYRCRLLSRATGEPLGEGRGVRAVGQKGGDANNAIKMAKKCSKVDAVLNAYGLADLFTQDIEDMAPDRHDNPDQRADAPRATPRAQRVTAEQLTAMQAEWKSFTTEPPIKEAFLKFCRAAAGEFDAGSLSAWTQDRLVKCRQAMGLEEPT